MWYRFSQIPDIVLDQDGDLDTPNLVPEEPEEIPQPEQPQQPQPLKPLPTQSVPPLHDNCHCKIETMPGGRQIWQFSEKCCNLCKQQAHKFNSTQFMSFGI